MKIIFSIKDSATEAFSPLFEARATGEALRMFKDQTTNPDSQISRHPTDFELYKVGMFDENTGELTGMKPERIARAIDMLEMSK